MFPWWSFIWNYTWLILQDRYYSSTFITNIYYDIRKIYLIHLITHICINMFQHSFLLNKSSYRNVTPLRRQITISASYGKPNCKTSFVQFSILNKLFLLLCYETPVRFPRLSSIYTTHLYKPFRKFLQNIRQDYKYFFSSVHFSEVIMQISVYNRK